VAPLVRALRSRRRPSSRRHWLAETISATENTNVIVRAAVRS